MKHKVRIKKKRGIFRCMSAMAVIAVMVLFMNVNAEPLSIIESRVKTGELENAQTSVVGKKTELAISNTVNRLEVKEAKSEVDHNLAKKKRDIILNGDAAEAIKLTNVFYTEADYNALNLPMVKVWEGTNLYAQESAESLVVTSFDDSDSVSVLYACEGSDFYYVEYDDTYRGYVEKSGLDLSILTSAEIEQVSLINRLRFGAVSFEEVTLWAEPSVETEVSTVEDGYLMTVTGLQGEWLQVEVAGAEGYVQLTDVIPVRVITAEVDDEGYIKTVRAELERIEAERLEEEASIAEEEAEIASAEEEEVWEETWEEPEPQVEQKVEEEQPVQEEPESVPSSTGSSNTSSSGIGAAMADLALTFLGTPYVYGGASPSGFDCSGLVYYCALQNGRTLYRCADDQYFDKGTHVSFSELAYGDLVFFSSDWSYEIQHIGIYIGGGQFVHASSSNNAVMISSLTDYYSRNYYGALRLA